MMPSIPALLPQLKKKADADTALVCVRAEGIRTASPVGPAHGYGPDHDMAHFVVESTFGLKGESCDPGNNHSATGHTCRVGKCDRWPG